MATPVNSVFLSLDKPLEDEIVLNGGLKLYLDPKYDRSWHATVTARVAAIPPKPKGNYKSIPENLKVGDEVCFSYQVVDDVDFGRVGDYFMPTVEENPYRQRWVNAKDDTLSVTALPPVFGKFNKIWVGLLVDVHGERLDGKQGNESQVKRWLSQFKFSGVQDYKYNNFIDIGDGEAVWRCNYEYIFAKKEGDKLKALGDRIICEPIDVDIKHRIELEEGVVLPYQTVKKRFIDRAKVVSGGEDLGLKEGDIVSFEPQYCEKYDLYGKHYFLIKKRRVNGTWDNLN